LVLLMLVGCSPRVNGWREGGVGHCEVDVWWKQKEKEKEWKLRTRSGVVYRFLPVKLKASHGKRKTRRLHSGSHSCH
jgi:hypothetical protein